MTKRLITSRICLKRCTQKAAILAVLFSFCSGAGCSRYEVKEDKQGRTIRVDRLTGDVTVLEGDTMTKIKSPEEQQAEEQAERRRTAELQRPKYFPAISMPQLGNGVSASLVTSWRDGSMYYRFSVSPMSKELMEARLNPYRRSFTLIFYDKGGFKIQDIAIEVGALTTTVDDSNKPVSLGVNDSHVFMAYDYRTIDTWNIEWSGFPESTK